MIGDIAMASNAAGVDKENRLGNTLQKQLVIQLTKSTIVLYKNEFWKLLRKEPELMKTAISRGKSYKREESVERRQCRECGN